MYVITEMAGDTIIAIWGAYDSHQEALDRERAGQPGLTLNFVATRMAGR